MKKVLLTTIGILCFVVASFSQANVFDPNDPIVNYNAASPPVNPGIDKIVKWVRTPRMGWNTSRFKSYFVNDMAFRLRYPNGYNAADATKKYPLIFFLHGGGEIAPFTDNEYQLLWGAQMFEQMMNDGKFNGFLFFPQQTAVGWEETYFTRINMVIDSLTKYCHLDEDRIIPMGLSIGGNGVLYYTSLYPQRTATAIPSSPSWVEGFVDLQQRFIHIPTWIGSGGTDPNPHPALVQKFVDSFNAKGGSVRWSFFPTLGHVCWNEQWSQPYLAPYWNAAHKANPLVFYNQTQFCPDTQVNAKIGITQDFYAYEWQKDGTTIAERVDVTDNIFDPSSLLSFNGNEITVDAIGTYRVRFKRKVDSKWSDWSPNPAVISYKKYTITPAIKITGVKSKVLPAADGSTTVPLELPAGYVSYEWKDANTDLVVSTTRTFNAPVGEYVATVTEANSCASQASPVFTVTDATGDPAPEAITDLAANRVTSTSIQLSWTQNPAPASDETGFEVYRSTTAGGPYTLVTITAANAAGFLNTALSSTSGYYFVVRAVNATGGSALSNEAFVAAPPPAPTPDITAPSSPLNVKVASITTNSANLTWDISTDNIGVTGYDIYVNGVKKFTTANNTITVTGLLANTTYSFTIKAFDAAGNQSAFSAAVSGKTAQIPDVTVPSTPLNLRVLSVTTTVVNLDWDNSTDNIGVTGYDVYVNGVKKYTTSTSTIAATGLLSNTTYSFTVKAFDLAGNNSLSSNSVSAKTNVVADVTAPTNPINLKVVSAALTSITLDWDNSTDNIGVTGYDVYVNNVKKYSSITSDIVATGLLQNTTYSFSVKAVDQAGNVSGFSNTVSGKTTFVDVTAPSTPANLKVVSVTTNAINLDWDNATDNIGVVSYDILVGGVKKYSSTTSNFLATGLSSNTTYAFTVKAVDLAGNKSSSSNVVNGKTAFVDNVAPSIPTGLRVVSVTRTSIQLDWNSSTDNVGVTGYDVYVNGVKKFTTSTSSYLVSGLNSNTTYLFTIKAFDQAGNHSLLSSSVSGKTSRGRVAPTAPANLVVVTTGKTYVGLYWEKSTDDIAVTGYEIYVDGVKKYTSSYNGVMANDLKKNTTYKFTVKATDDEGNLSDPSNQASAVTKKTKNANDKNEKDDDGDDDDNNGNHRDNNSITSGNDVAEVALEAVTITKAYPSPFNERLSIDFNNKGKDSKVEVQFFDMFGQLVYTQKFGSLNAGNTSVTINFSDKKLRAGMYMMKLSIDGVQTKLMKVVRSDN